MPGHRVGWAGFVVNTVLLAYLAYLPGYFLFTANRLRHVDPALPVPAVRVAFVVTRAPSEPWPVARGTLKAMLGQTFPGPYDVWLCDEAPTEEITAWCAGNGVHLSSRQGVAAYHRADWPRRTKCKEGNLAYFYDHWGYRDYDVVSQLDCDHVPSPTYLSEMVRPFGDPAIGYVAAPSVCDSNAPTSWAARGRLHREAAFHGPFMVGHHDNLAPACIGSHYAVRTAALQEIGGVGPELAEDFSTTFLLSSAGWQGAHAQDAEAHGEGPHTMAAMLTQEFQWSRSLMTLLYDTVPGHLRRLPLRQRVRFLFSLLHYPLLAVMTAGGLLMPAIAAVSGNVWVNIDYFEFLARWLPIPFWTLMVTLVLRRRGLLRPARAPIISWENWLYTLARWPFISLGVLAATRQKLRPRQVGFKVTPKERNGLERLPSRLVLPFVVFSLMLSVSSLVGERLGHHSGYVLLGIIGSAVYLVVSICLATLHATETARSAGASVPRAIRSTAALPLTLAWIPAVPLIAAFALSGPAIDTVLHPPRGIPGPVAPRAAVPSASPDAQPAQAAGATSAPSVTARPSPVTSTAARQLLPAARVTVLPGSNRS